MNALHSGRMNFHAASDVMLAAMYARPVRVSTASSTTQSPALHRKLLQIPSKRTCTTSYAHGTLPDAALTAVNVHASALRAYRSTCSTASSSRTSTKSTDRTLQEATSTQSRQCSITKQKTL